jgi:hypothetical protein
VVLRCCEKRPRQSDCGRHYPSECAVCIITKRASRGRLVRGDAYAKALGLGTLVLGQARNWPEAERVLKARPTDHRPGGIARRPQRRRLLAKAETRYPERALWTSLTELTTELGDVVHGKAGIAAARMGGAAEASIHVAAGAAAQAAYQLALARRAEEAASPFESKFRLFAAGRWPLGIVGSTLILF